MKTECSCYRTLSSISGRKYQDRCTGTKEIDICSCGGDRTKCDFYPNVRKKALEEIAKRTVSERLGAAINKLSSLNLSQELRDSIEELKKIKEIVEKDVNK